MVLKNQTCLRGTQTQIHEVVFQGSVKFSD